MLNGEQLLDLRGLARALRRRWSVRTRGLGGWLFPLPDGPPNGSDAKLHGQGPRAEARAARGAPACEARECAPRDAVRF